MATSGQLKSVGFEVFGKVQGVFFRKHTNMTAQKLGLVGYVQNTPHDTVVGKIEGPEPKVKEMYIFTFGPGESELAKYIETGGMEEAVASKERQPQIKN